MIKKFRKTLAVFIATLALITIPALVPVAVLADINTSGGLACGADGSLSNTSGNCPNGSGTSSTGLDNLVSKVITIFSVVVGLVAVIMIMYGGFRYITSGGESASVGSAKTTIIYAIVGLVVVALAQIIVHFVLGNVSTL